MPELKTFTHQDILSWGPCYVPAERGYCERDWQGTALDVLCAENIPVEDKLWLVLRPEVTPERLLHEFAIWCVEQALFSISSPDPRSLAALEVKRKWLEGDASDGELWAARDVAQDAVRDATRPAQQAAAQAVRWAAAQAITWDAVQANTRNATWAAADTIALAAAMHVAQVNTWTAVHGAVRAVIRESQAAYLVQLLEKYTEED